MLRWHYLLLFSSAWTSELSPSWPSSAELRVLCVSFKNKKLKPKESYNYLPHARLYTWEKRKLFHTWVLPTFKELIGSCVRDKYRYMLQLNGPRMWRWGDSTVSWRSHRKLQWHWRGQGRAAQRKRDSEVPCRWQEQQDQGTHAITWGIFTQYLSLISWFLHETPSTTQSFRHKVWLEERSLWSQKHEETAATSLSGGLTCAVAHKRLQDVLEHRALSAACSQELCRFPWPKNAFSILAPYSQPENLLLKGMYFQGKHCLTQAPSASQGFLCWAGRCGVSDRNPLGSYLSLDKGAAATKERSSFTGRVNGPWQRIRRNWSALLATQKN